MSFHFDRVRVHGSSPKENADTRGAVRVVLSTWASLLALIPVGGLFEAMQWPLFHLWGLAHGSFILISGPVFVLTFVALGRLSWFQKPRRSIFAQPEE